jgi:phosphatidylethanolamine/phosphatidyl-N-methylethanolamine N-methyltransferase
MGPNGRFVAYQMRNTIVTVARPWFGTPEVRFELLNVPPVRMFRWHVDDVTAG